MTPAALLLGQNCTTSAGFAAAGCGSINLLANETRKQRSSASYASLLGCMRCAPVCEVDCERTIACSVGVSVKPVVELPVDVSLDGGDLFVLGGLKAKGCSKWFELEGGFIHLLGEGGLELSELGT